MTIAVLLPVVIITITTMDGITVMPSETGMVIIYLSAAMYSIGIIMMAG
jgi:hypothetical protein